MRALEVRLPPEHRHIGDVAYALGRFVYRQSRPAEARPLLQQAVRIRRADTEARSTLLAEAQMWLGACLMDLDQYERAEQLLQQSYSTFRAEEAQHDVERVLQHLADLYHRWDEASVADSLQQHLADEEPTS